MRQRSSLSFCDKPLSARSGQSYTCHLSAILATFFDGNSTEKCSRCLDSAISTATLSMQIIIAGTGKLATELLNSLSVDRAHHVRSWTDQTLTKTKSIIIHAGSGRELIDLMSFCNRTASSLVELATGPGPEAASSAFPMVLCPNTNILMLKFMNMLAKSGHLFKGCRISTTESHQAHKISVPGTAVDMARSLGLAARDGVSIRDPNEQLTTLQIPSEHLSRHAYHLIVIEDQSCTLAMQTMVLGQSPNAEGVAKIISAICSNKLEDRLYEIDEFVENGWI